MDMKALEPIFQALFSGQVLESFPIEPHKFMSAQPVKPSSAGEIVCEGEEHSAWEQQQAVLKSVVGTVVSIRIEKIGLKDAQDYIVPFMIILIADPRTNLLDTHETPVATDRRAT